MNRVATWILGTISGVLLAFNALALTLGAGGGYGIGSSCTSSDGRPCTPVIDQAMVSLPGLSGSATFSLALLALAFLIGLPAWIATPILSLRRGSSARTAILVVAVIATALLLVTTVLVPLGAADVFKAPQVCLNGYGGFDAPPVCYTGDQAFWVALVGILWAPLMLVSILAAPAWVMTLTQTARLRQWGWFIFALLFSPIASLLYAFFGASRPSGVASASASTA